MPQSEFDDSIERTFDLHLGTEMGNERILAVENLVKVYRGGIRAVDAITFSVEEGEVFGFLGPNGAGKSTTIKCLLGLVRPTSGRINICGIDALRYPQRVRSLVGYTAQEIAIDDRLTGWENLYLQGRFYHLPRREIRRRGEEILRLFGLWERRRDLAATYSGGMLKRLDIAASLIHRPRVLFLDEPTLGLDVQTRKTIWEYIQMLRADEGITIFLTTHYMEEADALCDRVAIIDRGRIVALDRPGSLKARIGGDLITIRFAEGSDPREVLATIHTLPGVQEVTSSQGIHRIVVSKDGDRLLPEIVRLATERGVGIHSIRLKRPTLDDVYLHFTGRDIREGEGSREEHLRSRMLRWRLRR